MAEDESFRRSPGPVRFQRSDGSLVERDGAGAGGGLRFAELHDVVHDDHGAGDRDRTGVEVDVGLVLHRRRGGWTLGISATVPILVLVTLFPTGGSSPSR